MKKSTKVKSLLGALMFAVMLNGNVAHAELKEDEGWEHEGSATYEQISEEENAAHTQDNLDAQAAGTHTPATQDANAHVDNSQGGDSAVLPTVSPTGTDWEHTTPAPGDEHPQPGLEDEVDRKTTTTPTPTPTPNPTPTPVPVPKTGDESQASTGTAAASGLGLSLVGYAFYRVIRSFKSRFVAENNIEKKR